MDHIISCHTCLAPVLLIRGDIFINSFNASQPHHKENNDGCNQNPGSTGIIVAEVGVQFTFLTGRLRRRQSTLEYVDVRGVCRVHNLLQLLSCMLASCTQ